MPRAVQDPRSAKKPSDVPSPWALIGKAQWQSMHSCELTIVPHRSHRGIHVETNDDLEPIVVARLFKKLAEQEQPQVVVLGKQAIDNDANQTGQMLAGMMNWSQVLADQPCGRVIILNNFLPRHQGTHAYRLKFQQDEVECIRETDTGLQTLKLKLPSVITCDLRLNEPIFAKLPEIMKAKSKPLQKYVLFSIRRPGDIARYD